MGVVVCCFLAWEQAIEKVCLPLPKQTRAERDVTGRWEERLSKGPSEEVWEGLWAWLGRQREKDVDIEAIEGALLAGGWSDGMRVAPLRWLVRVLEGEAPRALRLARSLVLRGDFAQKEMLGRFLRTPVLSGICGLTLSESEEGNALLRELAKMREMGRIRYLSLIENGVDGKGLKALLESPHRGSWEELTLQEPLDDKAVMALAGASLTGLRVLGLRGSRLSVGLCDLLAEAGWVEGVERLDISENGLDEEALRALFRGKWSNVSVLWAEDLGLEVGEVRAMVEGLAANGACLRELSLCGNPLGSEGIAVSSCLGGDGGGAELAACGLRGGSGGLVGPWEGRRVVRYTRRFGEPDHRGIAAIVGCFGDKRGEGAFFGWSCAWFGRFARFGRMEGVIGGAVFGIGWWCDRRRRGVCVGWLAVSWRSAFSADTRE